MDARSQLAEVDELIATDPNDESLRALREDLLQLIALEEQESSGGYLQQQSPPSLSTEVLTSNDAIQPPPGEDEYYIGRIGDSAAATTTDEKQPSSSIYTAQSAFMKHNMSNEEGIAEAPDLGSFRPVVFASKSLPQQPTMKSNGGEDALADLADLNDDTTTDIIAAAENKQKKKKKKSDDAMIDAKFELPSHLVPLESDTPAQRLKKQRTAKALKSKFREKQKEAEHSKRQSDWKTFATKAIVKKKKGVVIGGSMFSTEEGIHARVGVISGGAGGRKMTDFEDSNKRHKFT
jgi:hypothetical protein